jgi:GABA(A) receptor-associated protein
MCDELKNFLAKPLEKRKADADRLRLKYPDKVPVVLQRASKSELPQATKAKFLMPKIISIGKVQTILRDYLPEFDESKALFIFVDGAIPMISETLGELDSSRHSPDGFLYLKYSGESTFGSIPQVE